MLYVKIYTCGRRVSAWVHLYQVIKVARPKTLCKTITEFSFGLARVPNVATANETGSLRRSECGVCRYFTNGSINLEHVASSAVSA